MNKKELHDLTIKVFKGLIGITVIISILLLLAYSETHYTRTGFVKKKAVTLDEYYFYDSKGNVWLFSTDEELNSDMVVEVKMYNNCTTDNIKDDMIVDYQVIFEPNSELKIEIEK